MLQLSNISIGPLTQSNFVTPREMLYTINGITRKWDFIQTHDSVAVIIFNVSRNVLVCVKQFRPAVYIQGIAPSERNGTVNIQKYPVELGITLEFCAGIIDKNMTLQEIAKVEIMEETGYDIPIDKIEKIRQFRSSVGCAAEKVDMFYAEVQDCMKTEKGGGLEHEGEFIEVVELTIPEVLDIIKNNSTISYAGFLLGLFWFVNDKLPSLKCLK